jgi:hypothetical protein
MSRRSLVSLVTLGVTFGVVLGAASGASAWNPLTPSRPTWATAAPYELHAAGTPDLGGFGPTEAEVRRGMDDWTEPSCSGLETVYGGSTTRRPSTYDGHSTIGWIESGWPFDSNAIGVTQPQFSSRIVEADMSMNGQNFTWITGSGSGSSVNAYSIVLHEGGHYFGLDHSSERSAIMYFAYSGGIGMMGADDQAGICALYPGGGSGGTDCTTTGCPAGYDCVSGTCTPRSSMGGGAMCAPCSTGADCANGICLRYPDGGAYCGADCGSSADCAAGDRCVSVSGAGNQCVRGPEGSETCAAAPPGCSSDADCGPTERCNTATRACEPRPASGGDLGASCSAAADCTSGLCLGGSCSQTCNWLDTASCPAGFFCNGMATGTCDQGLCVAGSAGPAPTGAACSASTDCASLLCDRGICTTPCIPGGAVGCAAGYACQAGTSAGCGSCQQAGALGDACAMNDDCLSGLCAAQGGRSFCTARCDAAMPCPSGLDCASVDEGTSVCVPSAGGLGADCTENDDCASRVCVSQGSRDYCTRFCTASEPCPRDYECVMAADDPRSVCQPRAVASTRRRASGCAAGAGGGTRWTWALGLGALGWLAARRRRCR